MRIKALIIPERKRGNITIVGSYRDNRTDKEVFLLASGKKVVTSLLENDRVFQHTFEDAHPYEFSFDENDFVIIPKGIKVVDDKNLEVYFKSGQTGTVIATIGGNGSSGTSGTKIGRAHV